MSNRYFLFFFLLIFSSQTIFAQYDAPLFTSYTTEAARAKMNERLIKNTIIKNLSLPLNEETEENWQQAFEAMEVMEYNTPFTKNKIHSAFDSIEARSISFQRALLEAVYTIYPEEFISTAKSLLNQTSDTKNIRHLR